MKIDDYFINLKNKKRKNKNQRPIAYIITGKNNNILVDLKGNEVNEKNKEGDYAKILINGFDVKYPELRINSEKNYSIENSPKIKNNINQERKNSIDNNKGNKIIEEISLQIDSYDKMKVLL